MGKNNKSIKILKGGRSGIVSNKNDIPYGQPVFDKDDNYLFVGSNSNTISQPITTNRLEGYYADGSGVDSSSPTNTNRFKIGPSSDGSAFELNSRVSGDENFKLTGDIIPSVNNTYNLGSSEVKFNNIYATTIHAEVEGSITTTSISIPGTINAVQSKKDSQGVYSGNYLFSLSQTFTNNKVTKSTLSVASIQVGANYTSNNPALSNSASISSSGAISGTSLSVGNGSISGGAISGTSLTSSTISGGTNANSTLTLKNTSASGGSYPYTRIELGGTNDKNITVWGNIVPGDNESLGSSNNKFNDIQVVNLNGKSISNIFESDGTTVKKAVYAESAGTAENAQTAEQAETATESDMAKAIAISYSEYQPDAQSTLGFYISNNANDLLNNTFHIYVKHSGITYNFGIVRITSTQTGHQFASCCRYENNAVNCYGLEINSNYGDQIFFRLLKNNANVSLSSTSSLLYMAKINN